MPNHVSFAIYRIGLAPDSCWYAHCPAIVGSPWKWGISDPATQQLWIWFVGGDAII